MLFSRKHVMPGLDPGIQFLSRRWPQDWIAGSSPAMTGEKSLLPDQMLL
jgi:hypothetical protein